MSNYEIHGGGDRETSRGGPAMLRRVRHVHVMIVSAWRIGASWIGHWRVAIILSVVMLPVLMPILVVAILATWAMDIPNTASTTWPLDTLARAVDAVDTLCTASLAGGHVPRTASFSTVTAEASLLHSSTGQTHGPVVGIRVIIRAGKAQSLTVGAHGSSAVTSHLAEATGRASR